MNPRLMDFMKTYYSSKLQPILRILSDLVIKINHFLSRIYTGQATHNIIRIVVILLLSTL